MQTFPFHTVAKDRSNFHFILMCLYKDLKLNKDGFIWRKWRYWEEHYLDIKNLKLVKARIIKDESNRNSNNYSNSNSNSNNNNNKVVCINSYNTNNYNDNFSSVISFISSFNKIRI